MIENILSYLLQYVAAFYVINHSPYYNVENYIKPNIVYISQEELNIAYFGEFYISHSHIVDNMDIKVKAYYNMDNNTMYLNNNTNYFDTLNFSIIIHEMAHHFQNITGRRYLFACKAAMEAEAYSIQASYIFNFGYTWDDLDIDRTALFMNMQCE